MSQYITLLIFAVIIAGTAGFPIRKNARSKEHGILNRLTEDNINRALTFEITGKSAGKMEIELKIVQCIPFVIEKLRGKKSTQNELKRLGKVYGDLWPLIIEEASRKPNNNMNPIIEILLNAPELRKKSSKKAANDFENNTTKKRFQKKRIPTRFHELSMKTNLTPAERLLKLVGLLVRESLKGESHQSRGHLKIGAKSRGGRRDRHRRRIAAIKSELALKAALESNKDKPVVMRHKRSLSKMSREDEMELNALKSLIASQAQLEKDDSEEDDEVEETKKTTENKKEDKKSKSTPQDDNKKTLSEQEQDKKFLHSEDYHDYAFDTMDNDEFAEGDDLLRRFYGHQTRRAAFDDYDSFSDIMHLSAAQSRRDDGLIKRLHYGDNFLSDGVEDDKDDDENDDELYDDDEYDYE